MTPAQAQARIPASEESSPDWSTFEEVSQTFKDLWDEVNGFRVEVEELRSALESSENERDEAKAERDLLVEQVERLEGTVSDLIERLEDGGL